MSFIRLSTASTTIAGSLSSSTSPAHAIDDADLLFAPYQKNIIAIGGPLPPFSTTRIYRNIVLSNGLKVVLVKDSLVQRSSVALSIDGAGQFSEPKDVPGLAHLMEHIVLSSTRFSGKEKILDRKARKLWNSDQVRNDEIGRGEEAFEDWLSENDGDSNAFTAPGFVCFHFNCPHEILPEGLERFSRLFSLDEVENTIAKGVIPREIGRVADELDRTSDASRAFYFLKSNINPDHPFARFSAGSKTTLQTIPAEKGINVGTELLSFFREHYLASKATLVVVGRDDLSSLDRWISSFSNAMSQKVSLEGRSFRKPTFPDPMINSGFATRMNQAIILRSKDDIQIDEDIQTLCMEWPLALVYDDLQDVGTRQTPRQYTITAHAVGFILTQIISRRGPGSLRFFLEKFGWASKVGSKGLPRISFPVDVVGFQILRMEIGLTLDGFSNRSAVVSTVFESIRKVIETPLQLDLIKQYLVTGLIHGFLFAPRPPDAIALAVDSIRFGIGGPFGIASNGPNWYLMPSPEDEESVLRMRQIVTDTLKIMSDESGPLVSFRASPKAVFTYRGGLVDQSIATPPVLSPWKKEPITGARYLVETRANGALSYFKSLSWFAATFDGDELSPPYLNPLIPTSIRAPRLVVERQVAWRGSRYFYLDDATDESVRSSGSNLKLNNVGTWREFQTRGMSEDDSHWKLWQIPTAKKDIIGLPWPVRPPEPSVECAFVVQLLSSLVASFTSSQLEVVNLWLLSFDDEVLDLAELGAIAGIAYETSMNKAGLRICFRGVSQTLPSYVRRFCRRLVQHHVRLLEGSTKISESLYQSALRKKVIDTETRQVTEKEVAEQGLLFLKCTSGGILVSQGDVLPNESLNLLADLKYVFREFCSAGGFSIQPQLRDLLYRPIWKPRDSSPCLLPGISLISDACGRIPRGG
ncbi:hypothetical protein ACHAXA_002954 [Cyclostephanos tholiformis]|uniref:Peptidase M16 N-terminal domain-containing protein n=1 Tax=Cyclostephanos tholiformis TaxID=382380 RepID=A0ABD3RXX9_9STRA